MFTAKLKVAATALALAGVVAVPGVLAVQGTGGGDEAKKAANPPAERGVEKAANPQPAAGREEEARLSEQALQVVKQTILNPNARNPPPLDQVYTWSRRIAEARMGPGASQKDRLAALAAHRDRMRDQVALMTDLVKKNAYSEFDLLEPKFHLLEAERWLREGKIGEPAVGDAAAGRGGRPAVGMAMGMMSGRTKAAGALNSIPSLSQSPADDRRNEAIRTRLEEAVSMNFASPTPLSDVIKYVKDATQDEAKGFPVGLPIHVAPDGLERAEATMASPITIYLEGVPLRTTLHLVLRQLGMDYRVDGGVILISDQRDIASQEMNAKRAGPSALE